MSCAEKGNMLRKAQNIHLQLDNTNQHTNMYAFDLTSYLYQYNTYYLLLYSPDNPTPLQSCVTPNLKHNNRPTTPGIVGKQSTKFNSERP